GCRLFRNAASLHRYSLSLTYRAYRATAEIAICRAAGNEPPMGLKCDANPANFLPGFRSAPPAFNSHAFLFFPASLEPRRRSPRVSERTFEKPHQSRNRLRAIAVRLTFERIGRPEMSGAGDDDAAHKKPGLGKGRQERAGLRRRIDDVVLGAVDKQKAHLVVVCGRMAD